MPEVRDDRKYEKGHGWVVTEPDGIALCGISDFAQDQLTDVLFVETPKLGAKVKQATPMGEIESLKTISDLVAPVSGEVIEVNPALKSKPELVNNEPYGDGWLVRIKMDDPSEVDSLLDATGYGALTAD